MTDRTLRKAVIKLAFDRPETREHLLPLVRTAVGRLSGKQAGSGAGAQLDRLSVGDTRG